SPTSRSTANTRRRGAPKRPKRRAGAPAAATGGAGRPAARGRRPPRGAADRRRFTANRRRAKRRKGRPKRRTAPRGCSRTAAPNPGNSRASRALLLWFSGLHSYGAPRVAKAPRSDVLQLAKEDKVEFEGEVIEALPNAMFRVKLDNDHIVLGHVAGKMRRFRIRILPGDRVRCELSPYD